jgi:hypothetical protein
LVFRKRPGRYGQEGSERVTGGKPTTVCPGCGGENLPAAIRIPGRFGTTNS